MLGLLNNRKNTCVLYVWHVAIMFICVHLDVWVHQGRYQPGANANASDADTTSTSGWQEGGVKTKISLTQREIKHTDRLIAITHRHASFWFATGIPQM